MKKILSITIYIFCSFCAIGQYTLNQQDTSEVMHLSMPKGTYKLDGQHLKNRSHKKFAEITTSSLHNHVYKNENLLIYYGNCSNSADLRKLSLEQKQKQMAPFIESPTGIVEDSSKIIKINNIRFLTIESHYKEDWSIQFISDYGKDGRYINGTIEFKKPDEAKAWQYLQTLLNSMHLGNNNVVKRNVLPGMQHIALCFKITA